MLLYGDILYEGEITTQNKKEASYTIKNQQMMAKKKRCLNTQTCLLQVMEQKQIKTKQFNIIKSFPKMEMFILHDKENIWDKIQQISVILILSILKKIRKTTKEFCEKNDKTFEDEEIEQIPALNRFFNQISIDMMIDDKKNPIVIRINESPEEKFINKYELTFGVELIKSVFEMIISKIDKNNDNDNEQWNKILLDDSTIESLLTRIDKGKNLSLILIHKQKFR